MDVKVNTLYKNTCICYQGAYADRIAIKHATASQGDSQVTSNKGRKELASGSRCSHNKLGGHRSNNAAIIHRSRISIKIYSLMTAH